MDIEKMTDSEVYERGLELLLAKLGSAGTLRFLQQCESPTGDWTAERQKWVDVLDMGTLLQGIQEIRQKKRELPDYEQPKGLNALTDLEVYRLGLSTLSGKLGPAGQIRFLQLCASRVTEQAASAHVQQDKSAQDDLLPEILRTHKVAVVKEKE